jgi:predicted secreted Zn-dependent protease
MKNELETLTQHLLSELQRHDQNMREFAKDVRDMESKIQTKLIELQMDVVSLKTKAATWGAIGGAILAGSIQLISAILRKGST